MLRDLTAVINAECAADDAEYDCCRDPDHHTEEPAHVAEDRRANKSKESSHRIKTRNLCFCLACSDRRTLRALYSNVVESDCHTAICVDRDVEDLLYILVRQRPSSDNLKVVDEIVGGRE